MPGFECTIPARPTIQQDDASLRITRWDFEPGATTGWHTHGWLYFVVLLTDATLRIHDGAMETDVNLVAGQTYMRQAGVEHDVMNASPSPIAFVEIEVKNPNALALPVQTG
jgi:beta-alanine degradation protein BauB